MHRDKTLCIDMFMDMFIDVFIDVCADMMCLASCMPTKSGSATSPSLTCSLLLVDADHKSHPSPPKKSQKKRKRKRTVQWQEQEGKAKVPGNSRSPRVSASTYATPTVPPHAPTPRVTGAERMDAEVFGLTRTSCILRLCVHPLHQPNKPAFWPRRPHSGR